MRILLIALFGLAGVLSRYGLGLAIPRLAPAGFPFATLLINLLGCLLIGMAFVLGQHRLSAGFQDLWLAVTVGFLGGFTTFSSYSLDAFKLFEAGESLKALAYFGLSPLLGLACTYVGIQLARGLSRLVP